MEKARGSPPTSFLVATDLRAGIPKPRASLLGLFSQPFELSAVLVGEVGGAGESELDEVLVEGVFVGAVVVGVDVDVGKGAAVGR